VGLGVVFGSKPAEHAAKMVAKKTSKIMGSMFFMIFSLFIFIRHVLLPNGADQELAEPHIALTQIKHDLRLGFDCLP
jgi:hypothetical protein